MDLKQLMGALHFGAQHMTPEELRDFSTIHVGYKKTDSVPQEKLPGLIQLYKQLAYRQIDRQALLAELLGSLLLLSDDEQAAVEGAQMEFELSGTLTTTETQRLLQIRQALRTRQHVTLLPKTEALAPPVQPKRPSARRAGGSAIDAAAKLLKRG